MPPPWRPLANTKCGECALGNPGLSGVSEHKHYTLFSDEPVQLPLIPATTEIQFTYLQRNLLLFASCGVLRSSGRPYKRSVGSNS